MCKVIRLAMADKNTLTYTEKVAKLKARRFTTLYPTREWFKWYTSTQERVAFIDDNGRWI